MRWCSLPWEVLSISTTARCTKRSSKLEPLPDATTSDFMIYVTPEQ